MAQTTKGFQGYASTALQCHRHPASRSADARAAAIHRADRAGLDSDTGNIRTYGTTVPIDASPIVVTGDTRTRSSTWATARSDYGLPRVRIVECDSGGASSTRLRSRTHVYFLSNPDNSGAGRHVGGEISPRVAFRFSSETQASGCMAFEVTATMRRRQRDRDDQVVLVPDSPSAAEALFIKRIGQRLLRTSRPWR